MINLESHPVPLLLKNLFLNLESPQFLLRLAKFVIRHSKLVLFPSNVLPRPPLTLTLAKITLSDSLKPYLVSLLESLSMLVSKRSTRWAGELSGDLSVSSSQASGSSATSSSMAASEVLWEGSGSTGGRFKMALVELCDGCLPNTIFNTVAFFWFSLPVDVDT